MAYAVVHKFKGGTKEQYEASLAAVHPKGGMPEGQISIQPDQRLTATGRS